MVDEFSAKELASKAIDDFSIKAYAGTSNLTILDWRSLIGLRDEILSNLDLLGGEEKEARLKFYLYRLSQSPLSVFRATQRTYDATITEMTVGEAWDFRTFIDGRSPMLADMADELDELESSAQPIDLQGASDEQIDELMKSVNRHSSLREALSVPYSSVLIDDDDYRYVSVDLSAPDNIVVEHFKEWLSGVRKISGKHTKPISEADIRKWAQHRVLPYIDLRIISKIAGIELTNYKIGCIIFSDQAGVDVAEKVRKTTAPLADWLISNEGRDSIFAVANAEQRRLVGRNWG